MLIFFAFVDDIRYLSMYEYKYISYFKGHTGKVTSLKMSPSEDLFLSTALDRTLRLWDLRERQCIAIMHTNNDVVVNFDPEGLLFATGVNSETIRLYDMRSYANVCETFIVYFLS